MEVLTVTKRGVCWRAFVYTPECRTSRTCESHSQSIQVVPPEMVRCALEAKQEISAALIPAVCMAPLDPALDKGLSLQPSVLNSLVVLLLMGRSDIMFQRVA